jgi:D-alanyl-lipoteichoic acid acyltransferase DltB (MBOAT superfamily)
MIFTSWVFLIFLAAALAAYFLLGRWWRAQNILLLVASYVFYGFWDWRFLGLLVGMTAVNYGAGWAISRQPDGDIFRGKKRLWLGVAIAIDLLVLAAFKYFNFFDTSLINLLSSFGVHLDAVSLKVILPLGISFFTFMAITYPFDIYRGKMSHTRNFLDFALFVAFFPTVVSGPVERASHMLPQFQAPRQVTSDKVNEGLWLIAWGFFQKLVIADNVGLIVNQVFNNYTQYHGLDIIIAILAYTVQILADFGGYTDIARGVARLFGFELLLNFNVPYFAINPSDFWSRWHISLSQWFRDYLYISLGGNRKGSWRTSLNLFITMVLVGLWHGAAWTFVIWGAWWGFLQVVYKLFGKAGQSTDRTIRGFSSFISIVSRTALMLVLVAAGWAAFRSTSFGQLAYLFTHMGFATSATTLDSLWRLFCFTLPMIIVQIFQLRRGFPVFLTQPNPVVRGLAYGVIIVGIIIFSQHEITRFIYQGF